MFHLFVWNDHDLSLEFFNFNVKKMVNLFVCNAGPIIQWSLNKVDKV